MAIRSLSTSSISTGAKRSKFWDQTATLYMPGWDSISSGTPGAVNSFTIGSIPSGYDSLRLFLMLRDVRTSAPYSTAAISFNGSPTGTSYSYTSVQADSRNASIQEDSSSGANAMYVPINGTSPYISDGSIYSMVIVDIYDYANANKIKTVNAKGGFMDLSSSYSIKSTNSHLFKGAWNNQTTISSIVVTPSNAPFAGGVRYALYGLKG
jgi:hypothetical protein